MDPSDRKPKFTIPPLKPQPRREEERAFHPPSLASLLDPNPMDVALDDELDLDELLDFDANGVPFEPPPLGPVPADAKPSPVELPAPINPEGGKKQSVERHRNLFCTHYDSCLDEAVKRAWNSFTCLRCAFYHTGRDSTDGVAPFATQRRIF